MRLLSITRSFLRFDSRTPWIICGLCLSLSVTGCALRGQKQADLQPVPQPAPVQPPPAPEPQFSIPQTTVQLPSQQPVNPEAVHQAQLDRAQRAPADKPPEPPSPPKPAPRRPAATPAQPPPAKEAEADAQPPTTATPPAEETPQFQPILKDDEKARLKNAIDARQREIDGWLGRAKVHVNDHNKSLIERIQSFLSLTKQAIDRGDLTQADALSDRALLLARELQVE